MDHQMMPNANLLTKFVAQSSVVDHYAKKALLVILKNLRFGYLKVIEEGEELSFGDTNSDLKVTIFVNRSAFYSRSLFGGSIGNAESYVDGDWDTENLTEFVQIFVKNREIIQNIEKKWGKILFPIQKISHLLRSNTLAGSKKNIQAHYDMGNDFFKLFLDPTMMYSSAIFSSEGQSLNDASINKLKTIGEKLQLKKEDHLLEIGSGWGGLSVYMAKNYGCKVTTTTISKQQFDYTNELIQKEKLQGLVTVLFKDYRELEGKYNKLVSVEMIEAVGLNFLDRYFYHCSRLLTDDGKMLLQAITIRDQFYEEAKNSVDFIQRHIFPGTGIPSISAIMGSVKTSTNMMMESQKDYGLDYAKTLNAWSKNLSTMKEHETLKKYPAYLYRLWQYYFSYCEGGFKEKSIGLSQIIFTKPNYKGN